MPTFCRHNRLAENCSICSKKARVDLKAAGGGGGSSAPKRERRAPSGSSRKRAPKAAGVTVRRMERAEDDGYDNELLPGLRASADAERLAQCLADAAERLEAARGEQATVTDLYAAVMPGREDIPDLEGLIAGTTSPEASFDRAYERLARPGMGRHERVTFLIAAWAHGLLPQIEPWTLRLGDAHASDPVLLAAKRVFGTGDALLLGRRLRALCDDWGVPISAAEVGLGEWQHPPAV